VTFDLANVLTVSRILAVLPLATLVLARAPGTDVLACLVFLAAALTDWLDGQVARARAATRSASARAVGRMLDPIADKLLVAQVLLLLAATGRLGDFGLVPALAIATREVLVAGLREHLAGSASQPGSGPALAVTDLAKWKTAAQMVALGLLLLGDAGGAWLGLGSAGPGSLGVEAVGLAALWIAGVLTIVTGWSYLDVALRLAVGQDAASGGVPRDP